MLWHATGLYKELLNESEIPFTVEAISQKARTYLVLTNSNAKRKLKC
jgi:hypothetical protein